MAALQNSRLGRSELGNVSKHNLGRLPSRSLSPRVKRIPLQGSLHLERLPRLEGSDFPALQTQRLPSPAGKLVQVRDRPYSKLRLCNSCYCGASGLFATHSETRGMCVAM